MNSSWMMAQERRRSLVVTVSSGLSEIDETVIYGFRQASFFIKTDNAVEGKLEYCF